MPCVVALQAWQYKWSVHNNQCKRIPLTPCSSALLLGTGIQLCHVTIYPALKSTHCSSITDTMLLAAVRPLLTFRPRASEGTTPVGPPPSLICPSTVVSETPGNAHRGRQSSHLSKFFFRRSHPRISVAHTVPQPTTAHRTGEEDAVEAALCARGRTRSEPEPAYGKNRAPKERSAQRTCSRARSLPNILPCLSKADEPSSPISSRGSRSRGSSPVVWFRQAGAEDEGDESADPVLPRSARPVSVDFVGGLEELAAVVRGFDCPTSPLLGTPSPETRPRQIPDVHILSPLSPLWHDRESHPKTLSTCAEEEMLELVGDECAASPNQQLDSSVDCDTVPATLGLDTGEQVCLIGTMCRRLLNDERPGSRSLGRTLGPLACIQGRRYKLDGTQRCLHGCCLLAPRHIS